MICTQPLMRTLVLPAAVLLAGCVSKADPARDEALQAVRDAYADLSARKWPEFGARFAPGATLSMVQKPRGEAAPRIVVTPIPEFIDRLQKMTEGKTVYEEKMSSGDAFVHGGVAHVWSRFEARIGDATKVHAWTGIDAWTLLRHDKVWKIVSLAVSED